jgi:hypothetical protein
MTKPTVSNLNKRNKNNMKQSEALESAKEDRQIAEVKEAYGSGAAIQFRFRDGDWQETADPAFNRAFEWRVAPKLREWWFAEKDGVALSRPVKDKAELCLLDVGEISVHVREVL